MYQRIEWIVFTDDEEMIAGTNNGLGPIGDMTVVKNPGDLASLLRRSKAKILFVDNNHWTGEVGELCDAKRIFIIRISNGRGGQITARARQLVLNYGCWNETDFVEMVNKHTGAKFSGSADDVKPPTRRNNHRAPVQPKKKTKKVKRKLEIMCPTNGCSHIFEITKGRHMQNAKCPKCENIVSIDTRRENQKKR